MRGPGLFRLMFWRALLLVAVCLGILVTLSFHFQARFLYGDWQRDLQDQARWQASHWPVDQDPATVVQAWRAAHGRVRLTVLAADGSVVADSRPDKPPLDPRLIGAGHQDLEVLVGAAPLPGGDTLVLSRAGQPAIPFHVEFVPVVLVVIGLAALLVWPPVRDLTAAFRRLSSLAARVADGHFGETLDPPRQRELAGLVKSFNDMSQALRDAETRQRRLLADVSHELRSPLGRLRALGETIARRPEQANPHLAQMDAEIALMDRLIGDILEAARVEEGAVSLERQAVPLADWGRDAFSRLSSRIEGAGIGVSVKVDGDATVHMDAERLFQALGNLVDNAVAATQGRPEAHISLSLRADDVGWRVTVADNGRGIPAADLPHVFDRFFRVDRHRGRRTGGAGLGLGIARSLVVAQGGRLTLDSTVDVGTTATMAFPTLS
ncbi:signal transduction histidine kinase [Nitrospirillum amazonense]|uniref:histidine kinase n=1 Tax=Nitrospirillum amazonense TaxID=28077 RepID=A0A560JE39_9PROT|nr:HAMP domain-containing sensor histidine kinase [Nitrospirillum amazonense]TWB69247.1 signal transduction histidine kinase [Nitrospirillum amazonense]